MRLIEECTYPAEQVSCSPINVVLLFAIGRDEAVAISL